MTASMASLADLTAVSLGRLLLAGDLDARELTDYFIARIEDAADSSVFISTCFERARREAQLSAERYRSKQARGPLDGVPVAWKDLIDIAGLATTADSATGDRPAALEG